MAALGKPTRPEPAPALFRLLTDSALSRAALGACAFPLAMLDAVAPARPEEPQQRATRHHQRASHQPLQHAQRLWTGRPLPKLARLRRRERDRRPIGADDDAVRQIETLRAIVDDA